MVKNKDGIVKGDNCKFDLGYTRLTKNLIGALEVLDGECMPGASWDVQRQGRTWVAEPCNGPFEPLVYKGQKWVNVWD